MSLESRSGEWEMEGMDCKRVACMDRVKRELNIVQNVGIGKLGHRPFDHDVVSKIPGAERIEGYEFHKRAQRTSGRFLPIRGVTKHGLG